MDDTAQQQVAQPQDGVAQQAGVGDPAAMPNLSDLAGMTPPPPAPVPQGDMQAQPQTASDGGMAQVADTAPASAQGAHAGGDLTQDDYSYAEDILDEILDSLDRIEAKVEAIEKKLG